jgi:ADP-ribose pyrophosphatase YjhB (NUDIX family)
MFQSSIVTYPIRTFNFEQSDDLIQRAFQSLTKHTVPRQRVYGGILRTIHDDPMQVRYLLVQGRYSGKWSFPKGHSYTGEEPLTCALREIAEETGYDQLPNPIEYIRVGYGNYYIFLCSSMFIPMPRDTAEIMAAEWVTLKEMEEMCLNVDVSKYYKKKWKEMGHILENKVSMHSCSDVS